MSINAPRPSGRSLNGGLRPASDPPRLYTPLRRRLREDEWPPLGEVLRGRREQVRPGVLLVLGQRDLRMAGSWPELPGGGVGAGGERGGDGLLAGAAGQGTLA